MLIRIPWDFGRKFSGELWADISVKYIPRDTKVCCELCSVRVRVMPLTISLCRMRLSCSISCVDMPVKMATYLYCRGYGSWY